METVVISSRIVPNYRPRGELEAWFNDGRPFDEWPDWVRSYYANRDTVPGGARKGQYALRDEEGYFWRWMKAAAFRRGYERIAP